MRPIFHDLEYLYIHWPFCPYKCHFCDFVAMASHEQFMKDYHEKLCKELHMIKDTISIKKPLKTIYMGGGTPSTYPPELLLDMFGTLREIFDFDTKAEITIEVNPGTATKELLKTWHDVGINRLSIGVQSLKDQILKSLNRHQTVKQVRTLLHDASQYFENISVDFIVGLPGITDQDWKEMIQEAVTWPIKHIAVYFLMVQEDTPLYFKVKSNRMQLPPDDSTVDLYYWTVDFLQKHGFERYELSNFAKPGYKSRHNQVYWERKPYRGVGLGACSFNGTERFANEKNLGLYLETITQNKLPITMLETLSDDQITLEKIMLGLRQDRGVCIQDCLVLVSEEKKKKFFKEVELLKEAELLDICDGWLRLTPKGFALENEVSVRLFPD